MTSRPPSNPSKSHAHDSNPARFPEHRPTLIPPSDAPVPPSPRVPRVAPRKVDDPAFQQRVADLVRDAGADPEAYESELVRDIVMTGLKLVTDDRDTGELKLMSTALKELRYAYNVFAQHKESQKVTIFGSARTPPEHPDYKTAVEFSRMMAEEGWGVITGAGDGIMKAGHEGPGKDSSFGLSIRLPFETNANTVIKGDSKLVTFRYFFTRKLMFVSQCDAVVCFPGGFGTQDETFESLTLTQTGKGAMLPIVFLEGPGGDYWHDWDHYIRKNLLTKKFISHEDLSLYYIARDPADAVSHIQRFYRNYHSARYVRDDLVIRVKRRLKERDVARLGKEFAVLLREGSLVQRGPYEAESDHLDLPRLAFTHTRRNIGLIRRLIDRINEFDPE